MDKEEFVTLASPLLTGAKSMPSEADFGAAHTSAALCTLHTALCTLHSALCTYRPPCTVRAAGAAFDTLDASLNGEAKGSVQIKAGLQASSMQSRQPPCSPPPLTFVSPSHPLTHSSPFHPPRQAMLAAFDTKQATDAKLKDESKRRRQGALDAQANIKRVATDFVRMEEERAAARAAKAEEEAKAAEAAKASAEKVKKEAADKLKGADPIPAFMKEDKAPAAAAPAAAVAAAEEDPLLAKLAVLDGTAPSPAPASAAPVGLS